MPPDLRPDRPRPLFRIASRFARIVSLLLLTSLGTVFLMRAAPGYFDNERELSADHAATARMELETERKQSAVGTWTVFVRGMLHGNLGLSRQYDIPVWPLVKPRILRTMGLLLPSVLGGSLFALSFAVLSFVRRTRNAAHCAAALTTMLCAVPISVLALFSLLSHLGGPMAVLFALIAARDFRLFSRLVRRRSMEPHVFFARSSGIRFDRLITRYLLWPMRREVIALLLTSLLIGLNAVLPIEVIFGVPGAGQLAWSAAMNRDLPVLLAITLLVSLLIGAASVLNGDQIQQGAA